MRAVVWLAPCVLLSCAEPANAVLEVRMHLPTRVDAMSENELRFAQIAIVPSDIDLSSSRSFAADARAYDLSGRGCNVELSIVANDPDKDRKRLERQGGRGLSMLVWFCPTKSACDRKAAPSWLIDFDKALWTGERTLFQADVANGSCSDWPLADTVLPAVQKPARIHDDGQDDEPKEEADFDFSMRVSTCDVLGCLDDSSVPAADVGFCSLDGTHPCE